VLTRQALSDPEHATIATAIATTLLRLGSLHCLSTIAPPFAARARTRNCMSIGVRPFWIGAIAVSALTSAAIYLAGMENLARLM